VVCEVRRGAGTSNKQNNLTGREMNWKLICVEHKVAGQLIEKYKEFHGRSKFPGKVIPRVPRFSKRRHDSVQILCSVEIPSMSLWIFHSISLKQRTQTKSPYKKLMFTIRTNFLFRTVFLEELTDSRTNFYSNFSKTNQLMAKTIVFTEKISARNVDHRADTLMLT